MVIGIIVNFSEQHETCVRQSVFKLTDRDRFNIRVPDRTGEGMVLEMLRSPLVLRGRMTYREKGRHDNAHGQNKEGPGRQCKPPDDRGRGKTLIFEIDFRDRDVGSQTPRSITFLPSKTR